MKKLFLGSIVLMMFSISITLIQISCQKPAEAQTGSNTYVLPPATTSALGGVIVGQGLNVTNTGVLSANPSSYTMPVATNTTIGGVIVGSGLNVSSNGTLSVNATSTGGNLSQLNKLLIYDGQNFATINYEGTNKTIIPVTLPAGRKLRSVPPEAHLSPDGQKLFFEVYEQSTSMYFIYSCNINGSNLQAIVSGSNQIDLTSAY